VASPAALAGPAPALAAAPATPATDAPPSGRVFEASEVDVRPDVARRTEPAYPDAARARGLEDVVVVRVLVSPAGAAQQVRVLRPSKVDGAFDGAAVAAVRQWTFWPAKKRQQAVPCWLNVGVPFRLAQDTGSR
jgi:protein TonB